MGRVVTDNQGYIPRVATFAWGKHFPETPQPILVQRELNRAKTQGRRRLNGGVPRHILHSRARAWCKDSNRRLWFEAPSGISDLRKE